MHSVGFLEHRADSRQFVASLSLRSVLLVLVSMVESSGNGFIRRYSAECPDRLGDLEDLATQMEDLRESWHHQPNPSRLDRLLAPRSTFSY